MKPFSEPQCSIILREVLKGLKYLHNNENIHLDVKGSKKFLIPAANILLTYNGNVKLADFGVTTKLSTAKDRRESMTGTVYW
jgi:serine/threonine-protein kinase 24/25/MST4